MSRSIAKDEIPLPQLWLGFQERQVDYPAIIKKFNDILRFLTDLSDRQSANL
jgi:hypothetical protein